MATKQEELNNLCVHPDFLKAFNTTYGTNKTILSQQELFSVGTVYHIITVTMAVGEGVIRICDGYHDITYNGFKFLATGDLLDVQTPTKSKEINNQGMSVKFSNVRKDYINLIQQGKLDKAQVQIQMVFLNPLKGGVVGSFDVFMGEVDSTVLNLNMAENDSEWENTAEIKLNSNWACLDQNARHHASDGIHRSYPGNANDGFFSKAGKWNSEAIWTAKK
ncbi:hypothetical protein [Enterobacter kobei]|uniref:hypothetical protein n=1 Tax=Enterobacter kobei TaxID=208224 RepID=UPI00201FDBEE|nr:hypothetical protein [Enterobacter kobei]MCL8167132.1 hypothetical protein [Enterobacter kobei]MCM7795628.1 hypothetical protein [Enterobacter kobei]